MSKVCSHCGQDIPEIASRYGLTAQISPPKVTYNGRVLLDVSPTVARMVYTLCKNGRASNEAFAHRPSGDPTTPNAVKAQMCYLRDVLATNGVLVKITSISGWGYFMQPCSPEQLTHYRATKRVRRGKRTSGHMHPKFENKGLRINGRNATVLAGILSELDRQEQPA